MTSKDKTREKLVGSMRRTKSAAGIGNDNAEPESAAASPVASAPAAPAAAGKAKPSAAPRPETVNAEAYQSGRRVWPD